MLEDEVHTEQELLERVDEYTLYCFYLGFSPELDMLYRSPVREGDLNASWSLFIAMKLKNREYAWKDKGGKGLSGDIFNLVKLMFGLRSTREAMCKIRGDFKLGPAMPGEIKLTDYGPPVPSEHANIRIKSRTFDRFDLNWWKGWNWDRELLDRYYVKPLKYYWTKVSQANPKTPKTPAYGYNVMGHYKLYFPFERKQDKFRTDMTERELEGFQQLEYNSPVLVVTKSLKDVGCLRSFGYESVSPRGESTLIPEEFMAHFRREYKVILILFDNDGKHRAEAYPEPKIWIPPATGTKDPTDHCKRYGPQPTAELLRQLISPWVP